MRSNSRDRRSWMISRCSRPRKPQRKPNPSAADVSASKWKLASFRRSLPRLSRSFSKSSASIGNRPHHTTGTDGLNPGQRLCRRPAILGDGVADVAVRHRLHRRGDVAHLARTRAASTGRIAGPKMPTCSTLCTRALGHHADLGVTPQMPVLDPHQDHHAEIGVVPAIHQQRLERRLGIAGRRRQPGDQRLQHALDVEPGLGRDLNRIVGRDADHVLDLLAHPLRLGGRQVDLVQDRHDLVPQHPAPGRRWPASAPRPPGRRPPPAASPRRRPASGSPRRRNRRGRACPSG